MELWCVCLRIRVRVRVLVVGGSRKSRFGVWEVDAGRVLIVS